MFRKFVVLPEKGEDQSYGAALIKSRKSPDKRLRMAINAIAYVKSNDIVLAELLFDTSSAVDVDRSEIEKLKKVVEKYPIKYFVVYSPEDITEDFDDLIEFAYLLKQHGAIILSIEDDAVISYEMLKSIKKEMENDEEADGNE